MEDTTSPRTTSAAAADHKVKHDYHDHAHNPAGSYAMSGSAITSNVEQSFPAKLHYMLNDMEQDGLSHIVSWAPHGRCKCSNLLD